MRKPPPHKKLHHKIEKRTIARRRTQSEGSPKNRPRGGLEGDALLKPELVLGDFVDEVDLIVEREGASERGEELIRGPRIQLAFQAANEIGKPLPHRHCCSVLRSSISAPAVLPEEEDAVDSANLVFGLSWKFLFGPGRAEPGQESDSDSNMAHVMALSFLKLFLFLLVLQVIKVVIERRSGQVSQNG